MNRIIISSALVALVIANQGCSFVALPSPAPPDARAVVNPSTNSLDELAQRVAKQLTNSAVVLGQRVGDQATNSVVVLGQRVGDEATNSIGAVARSVEFQITNSVGGLGHTMTFQITNSIGELARTMTTQITHSIQMLTNQMAGQFSNWPSVSAPASADYFTNSVDLLAQGLFKRLTNDVDVVVGRIVKKTSSSAALVLLVPLAIWLLKGLFAHAISRFKLIMNLKVDLVHRIQDAITIYQKLRLWHKVVDNIDASSVDKPGNYPVLKPFAEEHFVFKNAQTDMTRCLWGREIEKVRVAYRELEALEERVRMIRNAYQELLQHLADSATYTDDRKPDFGFWLERFKKEIIHQLTRYRDEMLGLFPKDALKDALQKANEATADDWRYPEQSDGKKPTLLEACADTLFISKMEAYWSQLWLPAILLGGAVVVFLWKDKALCWGIEVVILALACGWGVWAWWVNLKGRDTRTKKRQSPPPGPPIPPTDCLAHRSTDAAGHNPCD